MKSAMSVWPYRVPGRMQGSKPQTCFSMAMALYLYIFIVNIFVYRLYKIESRYSLLPLLINSFILWQLSCGIFVHTLNVPKQDPVYRQLTWNDSSACASVYCCVLLYVKTYLYISTVPSC